MTKGIDTRRRVWIMTFATLDNYGSSKRIKADAVSPAQRVMRVSPRPDGPAPQETTRLVARGAVGWGFQNSQHPLVAQLVDASRSCPRPQEWGAGSNPAHWTNLIQTSTMAGSGAMFGILESLAKAATAIVTVPVGVVADVVTLGGVLTDKDRLYTAEAVSDLVQNLKDATDPHK